MAFKALHKVQAKLESIQGFFEKIASLFLSISSIGQHLRGDHRLDILREKIVQVYGYSLQICATIVNSHDGRLKKWIKAFFQDDEELDGLFKKMESAEDELNKCVDYATLDQVKSSGGSIRIIEDHVNQEKRDEMLHWLSPLSFDPRHQELLEQISDRPKAGKWVLDSDSFRNWMKTENSRLWYTGKLP
ncbi:hypothetical protein ANO14919_135430 [Xylariales sp. No.14919]|nr:hypothetical protein ANO14919_135430 [Xylariales sp. No.14919]